MGVNGSLLALKRVADYVKYRLKICGSSVSLMKAIRASLGQLTR